MTNARTDNSTTPDAERSVEARLWVARQLRFEHFLRRLEHGPALALDEAKNGRRP